jgi:hypothetical protein
LNIQGVNDVRQTKIHIAGPLGPELSTFKLEMANKKLKRHKSLGTDQIPAELIKAENKKFVLIIINLLIIFGIRRNCLRIGRSLSLYLSIHKAIKQILVITEAYHCCQLRTKSYPATYCKGLLHMQRKLLWVICVHFDAKVQLFIIYTAFVKYLRKNENIKKQCISSL